MNTLQLRNSFLLLLTAVIWGVAFVAQSVGMDYVGPYTFTCVRSFIGGLFLIPCIALLNRLNPSSPGGIRPSNAKTKDQLWIGGVCCGVMLCFASCFQQIGIMYTSVARRGSLRPSISSSSRSSGCSSKNGAACSSGSAWRWPSSASIFSALRRA
ncbi:EamA family transporter [Bilophila wadsworthia]|uniref:EamA family transporter n=1 Tax=Bilophila wadsworthia TaxID=35833 RepID=UPI00399D235D